MKHWTQDAGQIRERLTDMAIRGSRLTPKFHRLAFRAAKMTGQTYDAIVDDALDAAAAYWNAEIDAERAAA